MTVRDPNAKTITNDALAGELRAQRTTTVACAFCDQRFEPELLAAHVRDTHGPRSADASTHRRPPGYEDRCMPWCNSKDLRVAKQLACNCGINGGPRVRATAEAQPECEECERAENDPMGLYVCRIHPKRRTASPQPDAEHHRRATEYVKDLRRKNLTDTQARAELKALLDEAYVTGRASASDPTGEVKDVQDRQWKGMVARMQRAEAEVERLRSSNVQPAKADLKRRLMFAPTDQWDAILDDVLATEYASRPLTAPSSSLDHYDQARNLVEAWADVFGADVPARINLTRRIAVLLHQAARHTPFTSATTKEKP